MVVNSDRYLEKLRKKSIKSRTEFPIETEILIRKELFDCFRTENDLPKSLSLSMTSLAFEKIEYNYQILLV